MTASQGTNEPLVSAVVEGVKQEALVSGIEEVQVEAPLLLPALVGDDLLSPVAVDGDNVEHVLVQLVPLLQLPP